MDSERDSPRSSVVGSAGHAPERPVNRNRHYRQAVFSRQHEGASLERDHASVECATPFGENYERHATLQGLLRFLDSGAYPCHRRIIDHHMPCTPTGLADEENLLQLLLHQPLEVVIQIAVDAPDVESALMIGHKDIARVRVDIFPSPDHDLDK